jgi:hypothetical protein
MFKYTQSFFCINNEWICMNDLASRIAEGKAVLLSADDICTRLSISRSTLERWVRNSPPRSKDDLIDSIRDNKGLNGLLDTIANQEEGVKISFPPPEIRIGNSPRWSLETFKSWLSKNISSGD